MGPSGALGPLYAMTWHGMALDLIIRIAHHVKYRVAHCGGLENFDLNIKADNSFTVKLS